VNEHNKPLVCKQVLASQLQSAEKKKKRLAGTAPAQELTREALFHILAEQWNSQQPQRCVQMLLTVAFENF